MPLHAITSVHGEAGLQERLATEIAGFPAADRDRARDALAPVVSHPGRVGMTDSQPDVFAAVDVHYLCSGGRGRPPSLPGTLRSQRSRLSGLCRSPRCCRTSQASSSCGNCRRCAVLAHVRNLDLLVIDGYVDLDPDGRPGLGAHEHAAFGTPVIGVAKTRFRSASHAVEVLRGNSSRPLFVTAAGMPRAEAAALVRQMAGPFRLPDALRRADALAHTGQQRTNAARTAT